MRRKARALGLACALAMTLAACTHPDASPWTAAADPPAISESTLSVMYTTGATMIWERLDPVSGESRRYLAAPGDPQRSMVAWSPDGRRAVVTAQTATNETALYEVDLVSGSTRDLPPRADADTPDPLFYRDGVLYGWTEGGASAWRLTPGGWRAMPAAAAPPPDETWSARFDDWGMHYANGDRITADRDRAGGPVSFEPIGSPLHHQRGRFVLEVPGDDDPYATLFDERGKRLWRSPPDAWVVWWPGPTVAPTVVTPTPVPRRKYYVEPDDPL